MWFSPSLFCMSVQLHWPLFCPARPTCGWKTSFWGKSARIGDKRVVNIHREILNYLISVYWLRTRHCTCDLESNVGRHQQLTEGKKYKTEKITDDLWVFGSKILDTKAKTHSENNGRSSGQKEKYFHDQDPLKLAAQRIEALCTMIYHEISISSRKNEDINLL